MKRLSYAVVGTGAIGGFYGARLAQDQNNVKKIISPSIPASSC
ncbi:MAG: hypothetical protein IJ209_02440 [Bacteroidaceae bacterium]|nr:hypothetical protein [Bacteroidaceae bacterium]